MSLAVNTVQTETRDWEKNYQAALTQEILRSERRRVTILAALILLMACLYSVFSFTPGLINTGLRLRLRAHWPWMIALCAVIIGYEWAIRCLIDWLIAHRRKPSLIRRLINVMVEGSIPTMFLFMMATLLGPRDALVAHAFLFYFFFILVSILQLDMRLCLFTGLVAAVEYFAFAAVVLARAPHEAVPGVLGTLPFHFTRSLIFFVTGLIAGFIADQIKRQNEESVRAVQQRDEVVRTFGQYVSPQIAERLLHHPVERGGELRTACVMFLDIRNFTSYAAGESPAAVMAYLNMFFDSMIAVVNEYHGVVNKFLGDGFMAVFGAPVEDDAACRHALEAALKMIERIESLNATNKLPPTRIGIGLHMGQVMSGNVGTEDRKEYSVIGDVVNLASRIEQATKDFRAQLLISEAVRQNLDGALTHGEDLGLINLKGHAEPVRIFRIA